MDVKKVVLTHAALILASLVPYCSLVGCQAGSGQALPTSSSRILYVSESSTCAGRRPCYGSIQEAVDAAAPEGDLIKVAGGVYTSTTFQVISVEKSVQLLGGYRVDDWSLPCSTDSPAIIDAEKVPGRRGLVIDGGAVPTITVKGFHIRRGAAPVPGGGGIHVAGGSVILEDCVIERCTADGFGGGLFISEGSVHVRRSTFRANTAEYGGGLYVGGGRVVLEQNTLMNNEASPLGGAIAIDAGSMRGVNDLVVDNAAAGAGVYLSGGHLSAIHWTLVDNGRYGVIADLGIDVESGSASINKSIIAVHRDGLCGAGATARQTLFHRVGRPCIAGAACIDNLFGDPRFADPSAGDYHLTPGSAAVDRAYSVDVAYDMDGDIRPVGMAADIGADEIEPERSFLPLLAK